MSTLAVTLCHMASHDPIRPTEIGRRVLDARERLRLSQGEFADRARLSRAYISRLERGLIPNPTLTDLAQVAAAAEMSLPELIAPAGEVVRTRFSHDWDELRQQLDGLPPEIAEQVVRGWRESVDVIHQVSGLARRN